MMPTTTDPHTRLFLARMWWAAGDPFWTQHWWTRADSY